MPLGYLILAHLLGDFILQPSKLVKWKMSSRYGVIFHVAIHFILILLVFSPYLIDGQIWPVFTAFGLSFFHFLIDQSKINYDLKHDQKVKPFLLDQIFHFLTILIAYFLLKDFVQALPAGDFNEIYSQVRISIFLSFTVLVSIVVEVFAYQYQREKNGKAKLKINTDQMLTRVLVLTSVYILFMVLSYLLR
jgi:hypothetical protein